MKCINCKYMEEAHDSLYWCTNDESEHFHDYTGLCCEDECEDGEPEFDYWYNKCLDDIEREEYNRAMEEE